MSKFYPIYLCVILSFAGSSSLSHIPSPVERVTCTVYGKRADGIRKDDGIEHILLSETQNVDRSQKYFELGWPFLDLGGVYLQRDDKGTRLILAFDEEGPSASVPVDLSEDRDRQVRLKLHYPLTDEKGNSYVSFRGQCQL